MKRYKKKMAAAILTFIMVIVAMTACGKKSPSVTPGRYQSEGIAYEMVLEFDKKNHVSMEMFVAGFQVYEESGTYELNPDETKITFYFEASENGGENAKGAEVLNGTMQYSADEKAKTIRIGTMTFTRIE